MDETLSDKTKPERGPTKTGHKQRPRQKKKTKSLSEWETARLDFIYRDKSISGGRRLRLFKPRRTGRKRKDTERERRGGERREIKRQEERGERVMSY